MNEQIRMVLIGFGGMGQIYAKMLHSGLVPRMRLAGVCCRNEAGQKLLREEYPGVEIYPDVEALTACPEDFDAALIVTPHTSHVSIGMQMAALGKHILLDKPAGVFAEEVRELAQFCQERKLAFGMIFNNRQLPVFRKAKEMLDAGDLGTLHRSVWICNSWYRSPAYHASAGWRSSWNGECGGMMINQNPHYLDMWNWFFGMPDRVYAAVEFGRYNDFLVDDAVDIQFSYRSGFHGTFISATGEAPGINRLEIWGSKGRLMLENGALYLDENQISTEEFGRTNREKFAEIPHRLREIPLDEMENPYIRVFSNYARHLLEGETMAADGWDGLREVELANGIYVSGWEERTIMLPVEPERYRSGLNRCQQEERAERI